MFPGTEDSDAYKGNATNAEEKEAARRAAVSPITALRQIDTRIASPTRRERKLSAPLAELRTELDATEGDLDIARTELAAATAERGAIAARAAIPNATDVTELEQVADTSIQTLRRLGEIAGNTAAADAVRAALDQATQHARTLAVEANARAKSAVLASGAGAPGPRPEGIHIEHLEDQDMDGEDEVNAAATELQKELDALGLDHSGQRVAALRIPLRALKKPRMSGVAIEHLTDD